MTEPRRRLIEQLLSDEAIVRDAIPIMIASLKAAREEGKLTADVVARLTWRLATEDGRRLLADLVRQTVDGLCTDYELQFLSRHSNNLPPAYITRLSMMGEMAFRDWVSAQERIEPELEDINGTDGANGTGVCPGSRDSRD